MSNPSSTRSWCIVGAGAIGCALAGRLTLARHDVTLVARGDKVTELRHAGLTMLEGDQTSHARPRIAHIEELGPQDRLILAVKGQHLPDLLPGLANLIDRRTTLVPMMNGIPWWYFMAEGGAHDGSTIESVDPGGKLKALLPADQIIGCVVFTGARTEGIGKVRIVGRQHVVLGELTAKLNTDIDTLAAEFNDAGILAAITDRIRDHVWTKAAMNLATNPLSVISGAPAGEHFGNPQLYAIVKSILDECWAAGRLYGAKPTMSEADLLALGASPAAYRHRTSMQLDYAQGKALELSSIYDGIEELARRVGLRLPVGSTIAELARYLALTHRKDEHARG